MDAVKMTKQDLSEELTDSQMNRPYDSPHSFGRTYGEHRAYLEPTDEEHFDVYKHAKSLGLDFVETLCSKGVHVFAETLHSRPPEGGESRPYQPAVAGGDGRNKAPIILSTGMAGKSWTMPWR